MARLQIRLPDEQHERWQASAEDLGLDLSSYVRMAVTKFRQGANPGVEVSPGKATITHPDGRVTEVETDSFITTPEAAEAAGLARVTRSTAHDHRWPSSVSTSPCEECGLTRAEVKAL